MRHRNQHISWYPRMALTFFVQLLDRRPHCIGQLVIRGRRELFSSKEQRARKWPPIPEYQHIIQERARRNRRLQGRRVELLPRNERELRISPRMVPPRVLNLRMRRHQIRRRERPILPIRLRLVNSQPCTHPAKTPSIPAPTMCGHPGKTTTSATPSSPLSSNDRNSAPRPARKNCHSPSPS